MASSKYSWESRDQMKAAVFPRCQFPGAVWGSANKARGLGLCIKIPLVLMKMRPD